MILVYVRQIEDIGRSITIRDIQSAIKNMETLILQLRDETYQKLLPTMNKMIVIENTFYNAGKQAEQPVERKAYIRMALKNVDLAELFGFYHEIVDIMYQGGYLSNEGYKFKLEEDDKKF